MPELPEVEQAACTLRAWLGGAPIARAVASPTRIFRGGHRAAFQRGLCGRALDRVERRGKILLLTLGDLGLLSHLGMTGRWALAAAEGPTPRHSRARIELADGRVVHYCDARLFGRIAVHAAADLPSLPEVRALGPDPLHDGIDPAALHEGLSRTARPVKAALLDQRLLAGVGNIYATEALFRARVHPARAGRSVTRREAERLATALVEVFEESLSRMEVGAGVAYLSDGAHVDNPFQVYGRAGEPCPRCRRALEKETIGGRTSAYCARCQK